MGDGIGKRQAARPSTINSQPSTNREVIRLPACKTGVFKQAGSDDWSVTSTSHQFQRGVRNAQQGKADLFSHLVPHPVFPIPRFKDP
jgi:hypothetical protein